MVDGEMLGQKAQHNVAVGLDIGSKSINLVELRREGRSVSLSKIDSLQIEPAQEATEKDNIKRHILTILNRNKIKSTQLIISIKGQSVFMKFLDVLPVEKGGIEKTASYEARQQIPFPLQEVAWDAHIFNKTRQDALGSYRMVLVAVKKDRLQEKKSLLEGIKLRPAAIDVSNIGLYNCARFTQQFEKDKLNIIMDIGAESTDLVILKGEDFWMRSFAFAAETQGAGSAHTGESLKALFKDLQGEISRSIGYYYFQQSSSGPRARGVDQGACAYEHADQILLSGAGSRLQGLDSFLAQNFNCPVNWIDPFQGLVIEEPARVKLNAQNKILFTQALGLALRGLGRSSININLLKGHIASAAQAQQRMAYAVGSIIMSLIILSSASAFMHRDYRGKNLRLQYLKRLLNGFSAYQPRIQALGQRQRFLRRQTTALEAIALNRTLWLDVIAELHKMLPDDLWLLQLSGSNYFNPGQVACEVKLELEGKAASYEAVNSFIARLKSSRWFTQVTPVSSAFVEESSTEKEKIEVVKFSVNMKVTPNSYQRN